MRPEQGLCPFKGETEAPQAMGVSLGVAWVLREAKSMEVPTPGHSYSSALSSHFTSLRLCSFNCKVGLLLLFLPER